MNKVDNPENQEFLNIILKETDRIAKIIDQVSKKNFQLNPKPFNVHSILEKIPNFVDSLNLAEISVESDYDKIITLLNPYTSRETGNIAAYTIIRIIATSNQKINPMIIKICFFFGLLYSLNFLRQINDTCSYELNNGFLPLTPKISHSLFEVRL